MDSGPPEDYSKSYVKGSLSLTEDTFENWLSDFISETPYINTDSVYCDLPVNLAEKLYGADFANACFMKSSAFIMKPEKSENEKIK